MVVLVVVVWLFTDLHAVPGYSSTTAVLAKAGRGEV